MEESDTDGSLGYPGDLTRQNPKQLEKNTPKKSPKKQYKSLKPVITPPKVTMDHFVIRTSKAGEVAAKTSSALTRTIKQPRKGATKGKSSNRPAGSGSVKPPLITIDDTPPRSIPSTSQPQCIDDDTTRNNPVATAGRAPGCHTMNISERIRNDAKRQEEADRRLALQLQKDEQEGIPNPSGSNSMSGVGHSSKYFEHSSGRSEFPAKSNQVGANIGAQGTSNVASVGEMSDDDLMLLDAALDYEQGASATNNPPLMDCVPGPSTSSNWPRKPIAMEQGAFNEMDSNGVTHRAQYVVRESNSEQQPIGEPQEILLGFDTINGRTWIYPSSEKMEIRDYQRSIIRSSLFNNTLVCLPTGLGKTFIAAVVMFNFYRWYPTGKIVFLAPTRPLVDQQIEACYKIMGIPQCDMIDLTGSRAPELRRTDWKEKRVFFMTPQTMASDLGRGVVPVREIRCVVVDEAHKATGNHAYVQVVRGLKSMNHSQFRVLALSATPGSDGKKVQEIIQNLLISKTEIRTDQSIDIVPFVHGRELRKEVVKLSPELKELIALFERGLRDYLEKLVKSKALYSADPTKYSTFQLMQAAQRVKQEQKNAFNMKLTQWYFAFLQSMFYGYDLLLRHGMRCLFASLKDTLKRKAQVAMELNKNASLSEMWELVESKFSGLSNVSLDTSKLGAQTPGPGLRENDALSPTKEIHDLAVIESSHPKLPRLREILEEFFQTKQDAQVMVFSSFRNSVAEIVDYLKRFRPLIKPAEFKGQSSGPKKPVRKKAANKGGPSAKAGRPKKAASAAATEDVDEEEYQLQLAMEGDLEEAVPEAKKKKNTTTQKKQLQTIQSFKSGEFNVLVSTCVGEEGLDIGEVDMIINYDCPTSATRLVQRMGRTGRKRQGQIIVLVTEGKEESMYYRSQMGKKRANDLITNAKGLEFYEENPRMVPIGLNPAMTMQVLQVKPDYDKNVRKKEKHGTNGFMTELEEAFYKRCYELKPEEAAKLPFIPKFGKRKLLALETKSIEELPDNPLLEDGQMNLAKYTMYQWDLQKNICPDSEFRVDSSRRSEDYTWIVGEAQKAEVGRTNPKKTSRSSVSVTADPDRWGLAFREEDVLMTQEVEYKAPEIDLDDLERREMPKLEGKEALLLRRAINQRQLASQILSADRKLQLMASAKAAAKAKMIARQGVPKRNLMKRKRAKKLKKEGSNVMVESEFRPLTPPISPNFFLDLDGEEARKRSRIYEGMIAEIESMLSSGYQLVHSPEKKQVDLSNTVCSPPHSPNRLELIQGSTPVATSFGAKIQTSLKIEGQGGVAGRSIFERFSNNEEVTTKKPDDSDASFLVGMDFAEIDALVEQPAQDPSSTRMDEVHAIVQPCCSSEETPFKNPSGAGFTRTESSMTPLSSGMSENTAVDYLMARSESRDSLCTLPFSPRDVDQIRRNLSGKKLLSQKESFVLSSSKKVLSSVPNSSSTHLNVSQSANAKEIQSSFVKPRSLFQRQSNISTVEFTKPSDRGSRMMPSPALVDHSAEKACPKTILRSENVAASRFAVNCISPLKHGAAGTSRISMSNLDLGFDFESPSPPSETRAENPSRIGGNNSKPKNNHASSRRISTELDLGFSFDSPSPPNQDVAQNCSTELRNESCSPQPGTREEKPSVRRISTEIVLGFNLDSPSPPPEERINDSKRSSIFGGIDLGFDLDSPNRQTLSNVPKPRPAKTSPYFVKSEPSLFSLRNQSTASFDSNPSAIVGDANSCLFEEQEMFTDSKSASIFPCPLTEATPEKTPGCSETNLVSPEDDDLSSFDIGESSPIL